jgi:hypothetical protein
MHAWVATLLFLVSAASQARAESNALEVDTQIQGRRDSLGPYFAAALGMGHNLSPNQMLTSSPRLALPSIALGVREPSGTAMTLGVLPMRANENRSSGDVLVEAAARIAPHLISDEYLRLSFAFSALAESKDGKAERHRLFGAHAGYAFAISDWELACDVGIRLGDHIRDGFVAIPEVRLSFGFDLPGTGLI